MSTESSSPKSSDASVAPLEGIRLLVVDDSKINLLVAEKLLLHAGASVHLEYDGSTAVDWLKINGQTTDLVFLDVQMPIMDGLTAVGLIRSELGLRHLPVIAMTGADSEEEMAHALACGMTDHVIKPFNYKKLVSVVLQYVDKNTPLSNTLVSSDPVSVGTDWPEITGIETQKAKIGYMGDWDAFLKQLNRLMLEFEHLQHPVSLPVNQQAWRELAMDMHKLVGNAGLLSAESLALAAKRVELLTKDGETQGLRAALQEVAAQFSLVRQGISTTVVNHPAKPQSNEVQPILDRAVLENWVKELEDQKFSAVKHFAELKGALTGVLVTEHMSELTAAMDGLDFERALEIVKPLSGAE
ncbi:MAG: response regulator [Actinomycetota bacterium]|nr:response regulator [Actinomycetota bacterium]